MLLNGNSQGQANNAIFLSLLTSIRDTAATTPVASSSQHQLTTPIFKLLRKEATASLFATVYRHKGMLNSIGAYEEEPEY